MSESFVATLPLQSKRILVTRTRDQASALCEQLRSLGGVPIEFPTIRIVPPSDWTELDLALRQLYAHDTQGNTHYDWLVLTSVNGVHICFERVRELGYEPQALTNVRVATIGPATANALSTYGLSAALIPDEYIAEGVFAALEKDAQQRGISLVGQRFLLARAAEARKNLFSDLQQAGAIVHEVAAYNTLPVTQDDEQGQHVLHLLQERQLDVLTFTSSSTVRNFMAWLHSCEQQLPAMSVQQFLMQAQLIIACIGPITSQTARELGLTVHIEAKTFTINGLVEAIVQYKEQEDRA